MELHVIRNSQRGFTLVEVLVALVIIAIILLGNMAALSLSYRRNLQNIFRDEAVKVAQEAMEVYRDSASCPSSPVTRQIRNYQQQFQVACDLTSLMNGNITQLTVTVSWEYPEGESHSIEMVSYVE